MTTTTGPVALRLVLVGLLGGILQLAAVSQVTVFGVPADLAPLLVGAVGLLCGSTTGAAFGFGMGLFMDMALVQTLGVNSLVPVLVGLLATAVAAVGFALVQFLLGVDAPVSLLLLRSILLVVVLNTLLALPVYAAVRRALLRVLPEDPRRRRRRAYTTGGLSPLSRA